MAKIKDLPKHKRPREKLSEKGAENLSDAELLAILIRTGRAGKSALDIAKETLKKYPLSKLLAVSKDELTSIKGLEIPKPALHKKSGLVKKSVFYLQSLLIQSKWSFKLVSRQYKIFRDCCKKVAAL